MSSTEIDQIVQNLDAAFSRRDMQAVLSFYEEHAVVVVEPGRLAVGRQQLERMFAFLFTLDGVAEAITSKVIVADDIALYLSRWRFSGVAADGAPFAQERIATCVFRRADDGRWRMIIDNSYGPAILDALAP